MAPFCGAPISPDPADKKPWLCRKRSRCNIGSAVMRQKRALSGKYNYPREICGRSSDPQPPSVNTPPPLFGFGVTHRLGCSLFLKGPKRCFAPHARLGERPERNALRSYKVACSGCGFEPRLQGGSEFEAIANPKNAVRHRRGSVHLKPPWRGTGVWRPHRGNIRREAEEEAHLG